MLVKDIMSQEVINVKTDTLLERVAQILHEKHLKGVPVLNQYGIIEGLITESELFSSDQKIYLPMYGQLIKRTEFVANSKAEGLPYEADRITKITAKEIMNTKVYFARADMEVSELATKIANLKQDPIPVTDNGNRLLGIVSRGDIIRALTGTKKASPIAGKQAKFVEKEVEFVAEDISSRFAFISKSRARFWLLAITIIFALGFLAGILYVINPLILTKKF